MYSKINIYNLYKNFFFKTILILIIYKYLYFKINSLNICNFKFLSYLFFNFMKIFYTFCILFYFNS
jgi:hypothetical protein